MLVPCLSCCKTLLWSSDALMDLSEEESAPLVNRDWGGSQRSSSSSTFSLQVHLYFSPNTKDASTIHITSGPISAENICIQAGKKCGKNLPADWGLLIAQDTSCWGYDWSILESMTDRLGSLPLGILPVNQSLFGLASADLSFWYPPSHVFSTEENLQVHFRVR